MTNFLDVILSAVWRASWQAAVLALLVAVVVYACGPRLAPRWRFLLWSVVLVRLLFVVTPESPWSMFNLARWGKAEGTLTEMAAAPVEAEGIELQRMISENSESVAAVDREAQAQSPAPAAGAVPVEASPAIAADWSFDPWRALAWVWLAGFVAFSAHLAAKTMLLRRRALSRRRVTDEPILQTLETLSRHYRVARVPELLVTPEPVSPCILGTLRPRIVLPESMLTEAGRERIEHVLAHELAHLVRGDLWTNWVMHFAWRLHWFNPVAWWTVRAMQAEREAACDELALAALGEGQRPAYAETILDLAANLAPARIAPGMIGLFASRRRLAGRIEQVVRGPSLKRLWAPAAFGVLLAVGLFGLTDATRAVEGEQEEKPKDAAVAQKDVTEEIVAPSDDYSIKGLCREFENRAPLAGVRVRLFKGEGRIPAPVEIAETVSNEEGRFEFKGLVTPRSYERVDRLNYVAVAEQKDGPYCFEHWFLGHRDEMRISIPREQRTISGKVVDPRGRPVANATVTYNSFHGGQAIPGIASATTNAAGEFAIPRVPVWKRAGKESSATTVTVRHVDYPQAVGEAPIGVDAITVKLAAGCTVEGSAIDETTGQPMPGVVIEIENVDVGAGEVVAETGADGSFRVVLPEGRYEFTPVAADRVGAALSPPDCPAGEIVKLSPFRMVAGGIISGRAINTATGQPLTRTPDGEIITFGLYGPSQPPPGRVTRQRLHATADDEGRFTIRAYPGEDFPYFLNMLGDRTAFTTMKQPGVMVREGQTTYYDMRYTPPVTATEKMAAARKVVEGLPVASKERTARIIEEFRKLNHTVDETELWCTLMREISNIGREAVPLICAELDKTTEERMLRRLAFALRVIGDPRAVPALIRAIPNCLTAPSSDYGLIVEDKELAAFMQQHDLGNDRGTYFSFGRPVREVFGTLHKLTGQNFGDDKIFLVMLSKDSRRAEMQRRLYTRQAKLWRDWWDSHAKEFTEDGDYAMVNLKDVEVAVPPDRKLAADARLISGGLIGQTKDALLSPGTEDNDFATYFVDLDTGVCPPWPAEFPGDEAKIDWKKLEAWAAENGADLMCVTRTAADGKPTYVLRGLGLKAWEISERDLRNLGESLAAGKLPEGRETGELLIHYDVETMQEVADANGFYIYLTREGNRGVITVTDRVTRIDREVGGIYVRRSDGAGLFKGVRYDLKEIVP